MYRGSSIGKILLDYREKNKLSLRQLGDKIELSFSYLGKIEREELTPTKETIKVIAERLDLSAYRLIISAGYICDLEKDIKTVDLNLTDGDLEDKLKNYKIHTMGSMLRKVLNNYHLSFEDICGDLKIQAHRLTDILDGYSVKLEESKSICIYFNKKFYECFQVSRLNYAILQRGVAAEEDIAIAVHRYIERFREYHNQLSSLYNTEVAATKESVIREIGSHYSVFSLLTDDEIEYLQECLSIYRRLNLKPAKESKSTRL